MTIQERAIRRGIGRGVVVARRKDVSPPPTEVPPDFYNPEGLPITHVPFEQMFPKLAGYYNRPEEWDKSIYAEASAAPRHPAEDAQIIVARRLKRAR